MHGRTYKKYYFKITIFCTKQNLLVIKKNKKSTKIKHKTKQFAKLMVQVMRQRKTDRKEQEGNHKTIF